MGAINGITTIAKASQQQRQYAGFADVDEEFASKAAFETAIQNLARIPDGWMAYCVAEKAWFQADKVNGEAKAIGGEIDEGNLVHKTDAETINGGKTFNNFTTFVSGFGLQRGAKYVTVNTTGSLALGDSDADKNLLLLIDKIGLRVNDNYGIDIVSAPTGLNLYTQTLQAKSGQLALLSDIDDAKKQFVKEISLSRGTQFLNEAAISLSGSDSITAIASSSSIVNVKIKSSIAATYGTPSFPLSFTTGELWLQFDYADNQNLTGFIKITGKDN